MQCAAPTRRRSTLSLWLGSLAALIASFCGPVVNATSVEYQVKAAYLYKLIAFVDWPAGSLPQPGGALNLCVVGDDPFGATLDRAVENQQVGGRALTVRRMATVSKTSGCQVAYIGGSSRQSVASALRALQGTPSLTVTDGGELRGSVVQFIVKDNRVRFAIDVPAASQNGLTISAKLLSLALTVRGEPAS